MHESASSVRPKNRLLASLPDADFQRIAPFLTTVPISVKQQIYHEGADVDYVLFPNGGVISITVAMADGSVVETATVGAEGMVGLEVFLGVDAVSPGEVMVQVPDTSAERMSADALRTELARRGEVARLLGRYSQTVVAQMMQTGACNALHSVHERCARWLLMTHDRVGRDSFDLSQEYLAGMLGVRRSSVTVVAGGLQAAGAITYHRGHLTVLDRERLEAAACECYAALRDRYIALDADLNRGQ